MKRFLSSLVVALVLWAQPASAQIAFDAASGGATFATSWSHTVGAGSNRVLVVGEFDDTGGSNLLTAVTWNTSEALTKIAQIQLAGDRWVSLWYLLNPTSTTANIVLTTTAGAMRGSAISLTGVGALDVSGTFQAVTNPAVTITIATNAWIVSVLKETNGGVVTWTNATEEAATVGAGLHMADSHAALSGSQTTSTSYNGATNGALISASFTVSGGAAPSGARPCTLRLLGVGCEVEQ